MAHVQIKRRMGESDIAEVSLLLDAATRADSHRPLGEHKWLDLVHGGRAGFAGFEARESRGGPLVGYAQVSRGHGTWGLEVVVHPDRRAESDHVGHDLLITALDEIARQGGGHVHLWVPKPDEVWNNVAKSCGLDRGRDLYQMRCALPVPGEHSPIAIRHFEPGIDEAAWLVVNNRAFASHPEQGGWDLDTVLEREREPWFDPAGFLLHEEDGRLLASCWTKVHEETEPPMGEIYVISVDPDAQGKGLGKAVVLAGLDYLAGLGLSTGMLYVDSDNKPAVALYESLGFKVDHVDRAYVGDVAAA
ncbi:MAG: mycothiol synthase [Acidimicrobiales bacterium]